MGFMGGALDWVLQIIEWMIIIRALVSWFPVSKDNQLVSLLFQLTEPVLSPIRTLVERFSQGKGMFIDLSPIIAIFAIELVRSILVRIMF